VFGLFVPDQAGVVAAAFCGLVIFAASAEHGWAGSARDYLSAPVDTWLTSYNFGYFNSVTPEDGIDVTSSTRSNVLSQSVVVTRVLDYWGRTGGMSVIILPYRSLKAASDAFRTSNQGLSDMGLLWQINLFGAPALTRQEFRSFVPQPFASFHLFVAAPLGKYDPENPLNPSANRWTFFPTVNYSYTPDRGWTWLETYVATKIFTPNTDYRVAGASRLTQKPLFLAEGHGSRNLTLALWFSADVYYNLGGETSVDGVAQANAADTLRLGTGMGVSLWAGGDLILNYDRVVAKPVGEPDAQTVRMTIRQLW
jgi:hypothetical protein